MVNNYSNNLDAAIELAMFMGSAQDADVQDAATPVGARPICRRTTIRRWSRSIPSYPLLAEQAKTERSRPKTPFWTQCPTAAEAEMTNALIGKKSAQQALKDANGKIEAILAGA